MIRHTAHVLVLTSGLAAAASIPREQAVASRTVIEGFTFVGCFKDDGARDLPNGPGGSQGQQTPASCNEICLALGATYFSLQYGGADCWCDDSYSTPAATYPAIEDSACQRSGYPALYGGPWANAVFLTVATPPTPPAPPATPPQTLDGFTFVGCFKDDGARDLPNGPGGSQGEQTPATCNEICLGLGATYFSLQHGGADCWCDDSYSTPAATYPAIEESACQRSGYPALYGGPWANAVFEVTMDSGDPMPNDGLCGGAGVSCYNKWGQITTGDCEKPECRGCQECGCRPFCETWNEVSWEHKCSRWFCSTCSSCNPTLASKQSAAKAVLLPQK